MIKRVFPFLTWFKGYGLSSFRVDFLAGLSVALVLIPQSMAYAQLAGLPAYYGLYASFLPPMFAALFGSSRQLATGPVAIVSLMTAASLGPLATAGSAGYIAYTIALAFTVGVFQLALGVLRLGLVVNFLSHPVVNGFTNAGAIIIATSQLSKLFGVYVDSAEHHYETIIGVVESAFQYTHWPTLAMGVLAFAIMYVLRKINPKIPNVLVAVIVTTLISWLAGFNHDTKATLSSVEVDEIRQLIKDFDDTVAETAALGEERATLTPKLLEVKEKSGEKSIEYLELSQRVEKINLEIEHLEQKSHVAREKMRLIFLDGVPGPDGTMRFYKKGEAPEGAQTDGRVWRIKVGTKEIDPDNLYMIGGGAIVGTIPKGLPKLAVPRINLSDFLLLLPTAIIISLLGFMEAISIAKAMAAKTGQYLDPNQELIGQGIANILGSVGQSYPTSGSFSRSAVNLQAGALTGISSVVTSCMVVIVLIFFTPLLYFLPQATLAAVIMMAVIGLVNVSGFIHAYKTHKVDGIISVVSFLGTLAWAPHLDKGIIVGVLLSLGYFLYISMRPKVAHLSLHPDCSLRDAEHWSLRECKHIAVIRFDGPLFFASASYFEDLIIDRVSAMPELRHILLVANGINAMDASGEEVMSLVVDNVRSAGHDFSISGVKEDVLLLMKRTHLYEKIGDDHIFPTQAAAIAAIFDKAHKGSDEKECPLVTVCPLDEVKETTGA